MAEFHDLAELALNRTGQSWGNLGYWQNAEDYSDACRALALMLGEQAGLDRHAIVFDAGFGCGDQLLLWLEQFHIAGLHGVNLSHSQTRFAKGKLRNAGFEAEASAIVEGDINDPNLWNATLGAARPTHVLALDCAYHFPSRLAFFRLAKHHLPRAGKLALSDFMLAEQHDTGSWAHRMLGWMLRPSHIAEDNMVHRDRYLRELQDSGFEDVRIIDISDHVMPGFARAMQKLGRERTASSATLPWSSLIKYRVTGWFLAWAYRRSILRYCLVTARKAR